MKVIVIKGSINNEKSSSALAADKYIEYLKKVKTELSIEEIDLNNTSFAKEILTKETFSSYFKDSEEWINKLKDADLIVMSTSMTNFGYTAVIKNFIDKICVAGKSFQYKYHGHGTSEGLIKTNIQIITSQGAPKGWYPFGDHTNQLKGTFKFLGMNVYDPIVIDGTKTDEKSELSLEQLVEQVESKIRNNINSI